MAVRGGQPMLDSNLTVVRTTIIGGSYGRATTGQIDEFELKKSVCGLFDELERLDNGTVVKLEFRHGLPYLLETKLD